jgi:GNAT superfamily N-acetyltransferase
VILDRWERSRPDAAALVAERHARERKRSPLLPRAYEDPARAAELVGEAVPFCDGVTVHADDGSLAGVLTSFESTPDPSSLAARYLPERSSVHLVHGHAVADHAEPLSVYGVLFADLAGRALDRGITDFVVHLPVGDASTQSAWVALGFGQVSAVAVRDLAPVAPRHPADVEIRAAIPDELDVVDRLVDEEAVFHHRSPIFRPYRRGETADAVRAQLATELASDDHVFLIARRDGRDIGVLSVGPGLGSPLYVPDGAVYIAATAVLDGERGSGAGAALVDAALAWARDHGHAAACLHFSTANLTSTAFWTGVGFTPVMTHLQRRLDERIVDRRPR